MQVIFITSTVFSIGAIISDIGIRTKTTISKIEEQEQITSDEFFFIWFGLIGTLATAWVPLFNLYILVENMFKYKGLIRID